jgi:uncharacterized protein YjiS (DUF1127 family)
MSMRDLPTEALRSALQRGSWARRFLDALREAREKRAEDRAIEKEVRDLSQLDDHILRDMGMTRDTVRVRVRDRRQAERRERFGW